MKKLKPIKAIFQSTFYQLLLVYSVLLVLISLNLLYKYTIHFEIFALILSVFGIAIISKSDITNFNKHKHLKHLNKKLHYGFFILASIFIFVFRAIPYFHNKVPLGYDTGIYKYAIEHGLKNLDSWILQGTEPGFLYLMSLLKLIFSSQFILTWLFILFFVLLGLGVYLVSKEYFNKLAGLIALLLFALSLIQFKLFTYMYYKNVIGLCLMLFSIYFLKKADDNKKNKEEPEKNKKYYRWLFIVLAGLTGAVHRPTFYILCISYFFYSFVSPINFSDNKINNKNNKTDNNTIFKHSNKNKLSYSISILLKNVISGIIILVIFSVFYLGKFKVAVLSMFEPVLNAFFQPGESPGTFISFFSYQFSSLAYLPFALLGLFCLTKKRKFNMLFFLAVVTAIIVYFKFFFFNRFIIHLDIALLILASLGFCILIKNKKKFGIAIVVLLLFSSCVVVFNEARKTNPLVSEQELEVIMSMQNLDSEYVMCTSSYYSPWLQGYSGKKVIAPGLFDYDNHSKAEWFDFWTTQELGEIKQFLDIYPKPLYIFIGEKQKDNLDSYECFENIYKQGDSKIYKFNC